MYLLFKKILQNSSLRYHIKIRGHTVAKSEKWNSNIIEKLDNLSSKVLEDVRIKKPFSSTDEATVQQVSPLTGSTFHWNHF